MITARQIARYRDRVCEYTILDTNCDSDAPDIARDLVTSIPQLLDEIERLQAERPFCATCKWVDVRGDGTVWCNRINSTVKASEVDGICLWVEKWPGYRRQRTCGRQHR